MQTAEQKKLCVTVIEAGVPNVNGHIYPAAVLEKLAEIKQVFGTIGPSRPQVSLDEISHVIDRMWVEDNRLMAEIEVLKTVSGSILEDMLEREDVEFFPAGYGRIDENDIVQDDYELVSINAQVKD